MVFKSVYGKSQLIFCWTIRLIGYKVVTLMKQNYTNINKQLTHREMSDCCIKCGVSDANYVNAEDFYPIERVWI